MKKLISVFILLALLAGGCATPTVQPARTQDAPTEELPPTRPVEPGPTLPPSTNTSEATMPTSTFTTVPATPRPAATTTPVALGPHEFPPTVNPLTGQPVSDPNTLNRRPMAIKVQLYPRGQRPVYGVSLADIVYDYYQNDGLTRLNAVFYGNDADRVGPVRSARLFDENIIRMYKSIFAFAGAADYVLTRFYNAEYADRLVTEENNNCPPMCRVDPGGYNFLFTNTRDLSFYILSKGVNNDRQDLDGMTFNSQAPANGQPGEQLFTRYSISAYNRWDYHPASGKYLRYQDTQEDDSGQGEAYAPLGDGLTNQQISADNVVVLFLPHQSAKITGDKDALDIRLSGSGDAIAFRDGLAYQVRWNRPTKDSTLFLTTTDGDPFPFKPGNTWFQVVGISSTAESSPDGVWRIQSQLP
jgi:hypothetical protein